MYLTFSDFGHLDRFLGFPVSEKQNIGNWYLTTLKWHENRSVWLKNYADFNGDKIKTDKKPEVRDKSVFHTFSYQNTAITGIYSKSSMLNLILKKWNPIKTEKPIFLGFSHKIRLKHNRNQWEGIIEHADFVEAKKCPIKNEKLRNISLH